MASKLAGRGSGLAFLRAHVAYQGEACLIWPLSRNRAGYGQLGYFGKVKKAHHIMCLLAHGEPPTPRHQSAHSCGNGHLGCVHPGHLSWKTCRENRLESNAHGTGNAPKPRRLTIDLVDKIRAMKGRKSIEDLGAEFGVRHDTIGKIFRGETWAKPRCTISSDQLRAIREAPESRYLEVGKSLGISEVKVRKVRAGLTYRQ